MDTTAAAPCRGEWVSQFYHSLRRTRDRRSMPRRACSSTATRFARVRPLRRHRSRAAAASRASSTTDTRFLSRLSCGWTAAGRCCSAPRSARTTVSRRRPDQSRHRRSGGQLGAAARHRCTSCARKLLCDGACYERIRVSNYGAAADPGRRWRCASTPTSPTSSRCAARSARAAATAAAGSRRRPATCVCRYAGSTGSSGATRIGFEPAAATG